jgi:hypothetical protein
MTGHPNCPACRRNRGFLARVGFLPESEALVRAGHAEYAGDCLVDRDDAPPWWPSRCRGCRRLCAGPTTPEDELAWLALGSTLATPSVEPGVWELPDGRARVWLSPVLASLGGGIEVPEPVRACLRGARSAVVCLRSQACPARFLSGRALRRLLDHDLRIVVSEDLIAQSQAGPLQLSLRPPRRRSNLSSPEARHD